VIGKLSGRVDLVAEDHVILDVGGVGYLVFCSSRTLAGLAAGEAAALWTDLVVREDSLTLYGFATLAEREWRRLLTSVQGVGDRVALAMLGALGPEALGRALTTGDAASLRAAPGVGPKLAARLVTELRDRAPAVMALGPAAARAAVAPEAAPPAAAPARPRGRAPAEDGAAVARAQARADALSALANLGYGPAEAAGAVATAAEAAPDAPAPALIRAALRALAERM
jgi:Holliday junction DNA helicase RuvA